MGNLSYNLSRYEMECKCGCGLDTADITLVQIVQSVCDFFECKVRITSGCRCKEHNKNVGGVKDSQHLLGRAADCKFVGVSTLDVYKYLCIEYPTANGFGLYNNFNHIDSRNEPARWDKR
jgi:uncharacterized protein YcbK (DUF882 family)